MGQVHDPNQDGSTPDIAPGESRTAYERYRIGEAMAFLHMIPKEGIRPLYSEARVWARREGVHNGTDPMDSLLRFLLVKLPLPSFDAWRADVALRPFEYAVRECSAPDAAERAHEVTVDSRTFHHYRRPWSAGLHMYQDGRGWRGFISFAPAASQPTASAASQPTASTASQPTASAASQPTASGASQPTASGASQPTARQPPVRTANIFVDSDPDLIRTQFRSYRENVLAGLLRSALP